MSDIELILKLVLSLEKKSGIVTTTGNENIKVPVFVFSTRANQVRSKGDTTPLTRYVNDFD